MTISVNNSVDLKALLYALTQQSAPLPVSLQDSLKELGQALQQNQPEAARQLRDRIRRYEPLENAYMNALEQFDRQYVAQQRTKGLSATLPNTVGFDWLFINDVIPSADWVVAAKQILQAQRSRASKSKPFDRAESVVVVAIGGAAIGGAIAQFPGAIIGLTIAAAFGWYVTFYKKRSVSKF